MYFVPSYCHFAFPSIFSNRSSTLANPTCLTCHLGSTCTWATGIPSKVGITKHVVICACHHPLTPHKDFSTLLIQCQGPSHPHQLLLPLNPLGPATALKGEVKKRSFFSSLAPGPSPPSLAWPSTRVVSIDLPSGDQLHSRLHLPPSFDAGQQTPLLLHFPSAVREEVRTLQHVHQFIWMGFVFLDRGRLHASKENDGRLENGRNRLKVEVPPGSEFVSDSRW